MNIIVHRVVLALILRSPVFGNIFTSRTLHRNSKKKYKNEFKVSLPGIIFVSARLPNLFYSARWLSSLVSTGWLNLVEVGSARWLNGADFIRCSIYIRPLRASCSIKASAMKMAEMYTASFLQPLKKSLQFF